uniref:Uncharacterized protein n=1 Tax=Anguilla anguilla TaxID=7936 RepID=A0A0E9VPY2_ANGAN
MFFDLQNGFNVRQDILCRACRAYHTFHSLTDMKVGHFFYHLGKQFLTYKFGAISCFVSESVNFFEMLRGLPKCRYR